MFQFPRCASDSLNKNQITRVYLARFPDSEISGLKVEYHLPEAYRRLSTSFIATLYQGIHHTPLISY